VEDLQHVWKMCRSVQDELEVTVIEHVICCKCEDRADVLAVRDPGSQCTFVLNQAPKGYAQTLRTAGCCSSDQGLLGVMDVERHVPRGATKEIVAFYKTVLSAGCSLTEDGCRVHFAAGDAVRQSLTFKETDDFLEGDPAADNGCEICIYMTSPGKFHIALAKCLRAGAVDFPVPGDTCKQEADRLGEFRVMRGRGLAPLVHIIRSPTHPDCPAVLPQDNSR
jgi:hypothetical protein